MSEPTIATSHLETLVTALRGSRAWHGAESTDKYASRWQMEDALAAARQSIDSAKTPPAGTSDTDPKAFLSRYAEALTKHAQAATQEHQDAASEDLLKATGAIERNSLQVARLIRRLIADR